MIMKFKISGSLVLLTLLGSMEAVDSKGLESKMVLDSKNLEQRQVFEYKRDASATTHHDGENIKLAELDSKKDSKKTAKNKVQKVYKIVVKIPVELIDFRM